MSTAYYLTKGTIPDTENYSVLSPEVKKPNIPGGTFNTKFYQALMDNDRIYIAGQASSHCVLETLKDLEREIGGDKKLLNKIYILRDCMSPVSAIKDGKGNIIVDFPKIANDALDDFANKGMNIINSTKGI
jgi:nicotinamidase-related amidase